MRAVLSLRSRARSSPTGLPRPDNLRVAREIEAVVREHGAVPATIAILDGEVRVGLDDAALEALANTDGVAKCGVRDLAPVVARARQRRDDGRRDLASGRARRDPRVRHRRARRRPSRRARHVRRVGRPRDAGARRDLRRLRGREVDPRHPRDARAPGDAERHRARLPHRHLPGVLPDRLGSAGDLAGRHARGGGRGAARSGPRSAHPAPSSSRTRWTSSSTPSCTTASCARACRPRREQGIAGRDVTPFLLERFHTRHGRREPAGERPARPAQRRAGRGDRRARDSSSSAR